MCSRVWSLCAALLFAPVAAATAEEPELWAEKHYNPKPVADDRVLPMPCGGRMVFRRIDVPSDGWLSDRKMVVGGTDDRFRFAENSRYAYLAGGFTDFENPARRSYYLGKYEVTELQYEAILGEDCPKPSTKRRRPVVNVSWFEAVRFAHEYTRWLYENAMAELPREEETLGFLRLPTEAEWEFAARGGAAVPETVFQEPTFPMEDGMHRYVWFQGSKSSNNQLKPVGLLEPNPLGLHDILGNADELILEPFRLNKLSRLHGQAGGFVVKGGNFLTSAADVRSAYRQEYPHFTEEGPSEVRTIGFRVALAAPVLASGERREAIKEAWAALPTSATVTDRTAPVEDPVAELALITEATSDPDLRRRLVDLERVVTANIASRNEQQERSAKVVVRLGAFLGQKLEDDLARVRAVQKILDGRITAGSAEDVIAKTKQSLVAGRSALDENLDYYIDTAIQLAQDYPEDIVQRQLKSLIVEFQGRDLGALTPHARAFVTHAGQYRQDGKVDRERWLQTLAANGGEHNAK